jgi:hypothetical protein
VGVTLVGMTPGMSTQRSLAERAYASAAQEVADAWEAWRDADRGFRRDCYAAYLAAVEREDQAFDALRQVAARR